MVSFPVVADRLGVAVSVVADRALLNASAVMRLILRCRSADLLTCSHRAHVACCFFLLSCCCCLLRSATSCAAACCFLNRAFTTSGSAFLRFLDVLGWLEVVIGVFLLLPPLAVPRRHSVFTFFHPLCPSLSSAQRSPLPDHFWLPLEKVSLSGR